MSSLQKLPEITRKRLVQLASLLKVWKLDRIKSCEIAETAGWKESTVRHDLYLAGFSGGVSNGYKVSELLAFLQKLLELPAEHEAGNSIKKCCIAGLGRLGAALLDDSIFEGSGYRVGCGFDSSVNRVEILRSSFPLFPAYEMEGVIRREKIETAILCVPDKDAQSMADRLMKSGIKYIVNMTTVFLRVAGSVKVVDASPIKALSKF